MSTCFGFVSIIMIVNLLKNTTKWFFPYLTCSLKFWFNSQRNVFLKWETDVKMNNMYGQIKMPMSAAEFHTRMETKSEFWCVNCDYASEWWRNQMYLVLSTQTVKCEWSADQMTNLAETHSFTYRHVSKPVFGKWRLFKISQ